MPRSLGYYLGYDGYQIFFHLMISTLMSGSIIKTGNHVIQLQGSFRETSVGIRSQVISQVGISEDKL